jgi:hypothetical protein
VNRALSLTLGPPVTCTTEQYYCTDSISTMYESVAKQDILNEAIRIVVTLNNTLQRRYIFYMVQEEQAIAQ